MDRVDGERQRGTGGGMKMARERRDGEKVRKTEKERFKLHSHWRVCVGVGAAKLRNLDFSRCGFVFLFLFFKYK